MTLTTHALVGTAAAALFPNHPIGAFVAAFSSHLVIDSLPHWDYEVRSLHKDEKHPLETDMVLGKYFLKDCAKIAADALIGIVLSLLILHYFLPEVPNRIVLIGAIAGILPDPLQFIYWKTRSRLLLPLQKFHIWIQKGKSLDVKPWIGLSLQTALVVIVYFIVYQLKK